MKCSHRPQLDILEGGQYLGKGLTVYVCMVRENHTVHIFAGGGAKEVYANGLRKQTG